MEKERAPAFQFYPREFAGDDHVMAMDLDAVYRKRCYEVEKMLRGKLSCLRRTRDGHPEHPLYLPSSRKPEPFTYAPEVTA